MELTLFNCLVLFLAVPAAFVLSSSAGLGGSLIMVPALAMVLGVKEGVALAALLLAVNNLTKLGAYRATLPFKAAALITMAVVSGAAFGATLMLKAPEHWVSTVVIVAFALTLLTDLLPNNGALNGWARKSWAGLLALTSGATSGFSGMSGPLKGVAIRSLKLERQYFVGAAAIVSLAGDATKALVFAKGGLLGQTELLIAATLIPVMVLSTLAGRGLNQRLGEKGYVILFWAVMLGYTGRLLLAQ